MFVPATLSERHLEKDHSNWSGKIAAPPIEETEGGIEDLFHVQGKKSEEK